MGKRPYYIIQYDRDCDGYYSDIVYLGTNYKAALDRYVATIDNIKREDFLESGIHEEDIRMNVNLPNEPLAPGQQVSSWMNDDNECWDTIILKCMNAHQFSRERWETDYKNRFPNSKY